MRLLLCVLFCIVVVHAQLIQFQQPSAGKPLANGDTVLLSWTVVGQHAVNPPLTDHNYPSSLTLFYSWTKNSDPSSTIQIQASSGLSARPSANPANNMTHTSTWKLPNCRLFYRYPPDQYTFSFIAQPVYPSTRSNTTSPSVEPIQIKLFMQNNIAAFPKC
ncbi:hypothetical protein INT44_003076 [Umbelopsis vinacea]|uniref:Secreted protein n=1 Tax=Umbelopsis vinacea TaxID=44442 RepID=A0A8H7UQ36_9FUNG|nr:hypothetical protein INT44_003076 [Umbelopsis vinacea]